MKLTEQNGIHFCLVTSGGFILNGPVDAIHFLPVFIHSLRTCSMQLLFFIPVVLVVCFELLECSTDTMVWFWKILCLD